MKTMYKYSLALNDRQTILVPRGYMVRTVQTQAETICLWVEVNPDAPCVPVDIKIVGTGHPEIEPTDEYLGTAQTNAGRYVWHVYRSMT